MKNVFLISFCILIGSFVFGQSTCSCGNPVRCTANCSAGEKAMCGGYGGVCECGCFPVGGGSPIGRISVPKTASEITECGIFLTSRIEKLTSINLYEVNPQNQFVFTYNKFKEKIKDSKIERF